MEVKYKERTSWYKTDGKVRLSSLMVNKADAEMFDSICEYLGCSKNEAMRTLIRIAATHLPLPKQERSRT